VAEPTPLVTVAILAYNRREPLAETLQTLTEHLDYPRERLEIIVVDNASTDGTAEMVRTRFGSVDLIVSPANEGIAGWNRAFERGRGDFFLVLDDDCHVSGDALRRAVDGAREHAADMVSFFVDSSDPEVGFSDVYRTGLLSFWGCAVLLRAGAVRALGGFDADLFIWAHELEFTMRFLDAGFRHLYLPEVHALHMKAIPPVRVPSHVRNMRNVAAKLLRPSDAARTIGNLVVRACIEALIDPGFLRGIPAVLGGARAGLKARAPVRPAVSRLYRRDFVDLASQFRPRERLRHWLPLGRPPVPNYREQFHLARPRLYPNHAGALRIP
jgi:GT2 family glycosyltransferase